MHNVRLLARLPAWALQPTAGLLAQVVSVVAHGWALHAVAIGLYAGPYHPLVLSIGMLVTALASCGTAWFVYHATRPSLAAGAVLAIMGSVFAFAWPVGTLLGLEIPDFFSDWATGLALPMWQGTVLLGLGASEIVWALIARSEAGAEQR